MKKELNPHEVLKHGIHLFLNNRSQELKSLFEACLQQAPSSETGWILKAAYHSSISELTKVFDVIDDSSKFGLNKIILVGKIGRYFLDLKNYKHLIKLKSKAVSRQDYPIWVYFCGCGHMMTGDEDSAFNCFDNFIPLLLPLVRKEGIKIFLNDPSLNIILRQGKLCTGPDEVKRRLHNFKKNKMRFSFKIQDPIQTSEPLFFSACNGIYFKHFGKEFSRRLLDTRPKCSLYIHVSKPLSSTKLLIEKLKDCYRERINFGTTIRPLYETTTYFTCERFLVAEKLLNVTNCPIVSLDLDVCLTKDAPDFHSLANYADLAWYDTSRDEPASVCQASVIMWKNNSRTKVFLEALQAFCFTGELENPSYISWMLDQAALYSVRNYFRKYRPADVTFKDLHATGLSFEQSLETFVTDAEKIQYKKIASASESDIIRLI